MKFAQDHDVYGEKWLLFLIYFIENWLQRAEWVRAAKLTFCAQASHGVGVTVV